MISRRDNLLVKPWMQRRFENHRTKVQKAAPVIDNKPPATRQHVTLKLKKQQKEIERTRQIEKNNFSLLKRLSYVMRTNRVDNNWKTPQPNFLSRVAIFDISLPNLEDLLIEDEEAENVETQSGRKAKCLACTPTEKRELLIPEERVPWQPDKNPISRKIRSKSVPARRIEKVTESKGSMLKTSKSAGFKDHLMPKLSKQKSGTSKLGMKEKEKTKIAPVEEPQSITLSRGCLKLSVNFPADTLVKVQEGTHMVMQNVRNCKNIAIQA